MDAQERAGSVIEEFFVRPFKDYPALLEGFSEQIRQAEQAAREKALGDLVSRLEGTTHCPVNGWTDKTKKAWAAGVRFAVNEAIKTARVLKDKP